MKEPLNKRITVRVTDEVYEWLMAQGGADFCRQVFDVVKTKMEKKNK